MGRDEETDEVLVVLVDVPAQETGQDHRVAEAGDREQLRHALEEPQDDRLGIRDQGSQDHLAAGLALGPPVWNQAKASTARPTRNAAMPCFRWCVVECESWPGKKLGSDFAGSAQYTMATAIRTRPSTTAGRMRARFFFTRRASAGGLTIPMSAEGPTGEPAQREPTHARSPGCR